ncbi:hypothetical protein KKG41_05055 [Patescibacteria group bacterium]|nr:hypothetical protein [Patescibacteria group bacterium]MBU1890538.1 hypothetical protein [Patescibacteria group bacterium]
MEISPQAKKILLIVSFVIVVALIALAIYYAFFRPIISGPTTNENINDNANVTPGGLPNANSNREVNAVANGNVNSPFESGLPDIDEIASGSYTSVTTIADGIAVDGIPTEDKTGYIYYDAYTKKFYEILPNGEKVELSDREFYNVDTVAWSPNRNEAIISYPDGSNTYYNFSTDQAITLPKEIDNVKFSGSGDKIAYEFLGDTEQERWLGVSNPNGTGQQIIEPIGFREDRVDVNWSPDAQVVAVYREGTGIDEEDVYFLGQHGENFKSLDVEGAGFTGLWSPQGDKMLYSVYSSETDYKPNLWIVDARGDSLGLNKENLGISTWPDKCAFHGSMLYCAAPVSMPDGAGLAREIAADEKDVFYEINLETGLATLLAIPYSDDDGSRYSAEGIYISLDGNYLHFRNTISGKLEKIRIN